jgi:uncharacterized protein YcfJ
MTKRNHMSIWQKFFVGFTAVALLMAGTVALASYVTQTEMQEAQIHSQPVKQVRKQPAAQPQHQQMAAAQPACDDSNIVGILAGGAVGGILGNQVGKGSGNTAATIGGALGGAYVGGKYIPTRGATCR